MPVYLLAIYTALLLVRPMDWWEPILKWQLVTVAAIAALISALPRLLEEAERLWRLIPALKAGSAWVVGAAASWIPAFWLGGVNMVFQAQGKIYLYVLLIFLLCRSVKGYRIILWAVLLSTVWMAIHAVLQHHRGYGFANQPPLYRIRHWESDEVVVQAMAFGTFSDPNDLCLIFITAIPLLYAEFRTASGFLMKFVSLLALPLVSYGVWLTNSRGGYLGVFAMVAAYVIGRLKGFRRWLVLAASVAFLTMIAPSRFASGLVGQQDRAILWGDGMAMFKDNPWFGVGIGMFQSYQPDHKVCHNTYVHILAETGLVGFLPFFCTVFFSFIHLRRTMNKAALVNKHDSIQMAGMFSAAVGYFTSLYFLSRQETHLPYIMMALMGVLAWRTCQSVEIVPQVFVRGARQVRNALVCGCGSIAVMWVTIRVANALK